MRNETVLYVRRGKKSITSAEKYQAPLHKIVSTRPGPQAPGINAPVPYSQYSHHCNFEMMIVKELGRMRKQAVMVSFNCDTRICLENE
jgi:hypothetical protein